MYTPTQCVGLFMVAGTPICISSLQVDGKDFKGFKIISLKLLCVSTYVLVKC